jgi:hypothetical protein
MAKVYLSSTYTDLVAAREAVYRALRRLGHDVIAMEDYVATDGRPLDKCLADVASSDIYIGIIAWRYGFIPKNHSQSITELEFRKAVETGKTCLLFLLREDASWPHPFIDHEPQRIEAFRDELKQDYICSLFSSTDELAMLVVCAVTLADRESQQARVVAEILSACYRRAVFTRTHAQMSLEAMSASLSECRRLIQPLIPRVTQVKSQERAARLIALLDEIERQCSAAHWDFQRIDHLKLQLIQEISALAKSVDFSFKLPVALSEDMYFTEQEAGQPPILFPGASYS